MVFGKDQVVNTRHSGAQQSSKEFRDEGKITLNLRRDAVAFVHRFNEDTELSRPMNLTFELSTKNCRDPFIFVGV